MKPTPTSRRCQDRASVGSPPDLYEVVEHLLRHLRENRKARLDARLPRAKILNLGLKRAELRGGVCLRGAERCSCTRLHFR